MLEVFSEGWHQPVSPSGVPSKARWLPASCIQACRAQPGCSQSDDGTPSQTQNTHPASISCLPPLNTSIFLCTACAYSSRSTYSASLRHKNSDSHAHMRLTHEVHASMHVFTPTDSQCLRLTFSETCIMLQVCSLCQFTIKNDCVGLFCEYRQMILLEVIQALTMTTLHTNNS